MKTLSRSLIDTLLVPRTRDTHKGLFGHTWVIGGDLGMPGAVRLCAEAAARVGSGLVSVITRPEHVMSFVAARPEIMCHGLGDDALDHWLQTASVVALGPGLGQKKWGQDIWQQIILKKTPKILDADALNLLARHPQKQTDWILTPHPKEAARLLQCTPEEVQADREKAVKDLQQQYGGICILKGMGTLIADGEHPVVSCPFGNPGMSSGGMGDVLTGVIAGLWAQGFAAYDAACLGVLIHSLAADEAAKEGERGLLAGDLMPWLKKLVNPRG